MYDKKLLASYAANLWVTTVSLYDSSFVHVLFMLTVLLTVNKVKCAYLIFRTFVLPTHKRFCYVYPFQ